MLTITGGFGIAKGQFQRELTQYETEPIKYEQPWEALCNVNTDRGAGFLNVTTSEKKNGLLFIEVFSKLFNPQNYGHQGLFLGDLFYWIAG